MSEKVLPRKSALLVMDFQILLIEHYLSPAVAASVLNHTASLISEARKADIPVIYVTVGFRAGYPEVHARNSVFSAVKAQGGFGIGHNATAIHRAVAPQADEPVVIKHRISAFNATGLDMILRAKGIETLILAGITTSGVVLSTLRQAFDLDYQLIVVSDCCADPADEVHQFLMEKIIPQHATVLSTNALNAMVKSQ